MNRPSLMQTCSAQRWTQRRQTDSVGLHSQIRGSQNSHRELRDPATTRTAFDISASRRQKTEINNTQKTPVPTT